MLKAFTIRFIQFVIYVRGDLFKRRVLTFGTHISIEG